MCEQQQQAWATISGFLIVMMAVLNLASMILSITPKNHSEQCDHYFLRNETNISRFNYDYTVKKTYLTDIKFGNFTNYDVYGTTGNRETKCFLGSCYSKKEDTSISCSEACAISATSCEVNNETCINPYCEYPKAKYDSDTVCHYYNEIGYWRGQRMQLITDDFFFSQISDTVAFNEKCKEGFKECGYINKEKDKLCIDAAENCPINKIVIKEDSTPPTDFNYITRELGDKYLFYTFENVNNPLYTGLTVDSDISLSSYTEIVDTESVIDFFNDNPYTYDGYYTGKPKEELKNYGNAYLKMIENLNHESLVNLRKYNDKYVKCTTVFTQEKINEMDENTSKHIILLFGFSIAEFVYIIPVGLALFFTFAANCGKNISPMKKVLIIYLALFPVIFLNLYSYILVFQKKITNDEYYAMDYIDEFAYCGDYWTYHTYSYPDDYIKNYKILSNDHESDDDGYWTSEYICFFDELRYYYNGMFICYTIGTIFTVLYPLLIALIYGELNCSKFNKNGDKNKNLIQGNEKTPS